MKNHKSLKLFFTISLLFLACTPQVNLNNTKNPTNPINSTTQNVTKKGLSITYQDLKGNSAIITKDDLVSYKIGNIQKTEFGCSGCPSIVGDSIIYDGKEALTFNVKNPSKKTFSTKAEGDDLSLTIPYNVYKSTDEEFNNNGLVYNIKQKLKSEKKRFTEQAVTDETVFEITGGVLDKDNKISTPLSIKYSDEKDILIYTKDNKVSKFDEQQVQNGNTKPTSVRDQTSEENSFINNTKENLNTISKEVLKVGTITYSTNPSSTPVAPTQSDLKTPSSNSSVTSSINPTPVPSKECIVKFKPSDLPLNPFLEKQLKDQNCKIVTQ